jgi:membrane protein implicated in regulation of membrane protease activity
MVHRVTKDLRSVPRIAGLTLLYFMLLLFVFMFAVLLLLLRATALKIFIFFCVMIVAYILCLYLCRNEHRTKIGNSPDIKGIFDTYNAYDRH